MRMRTCASLAIGLFSAALGIQLAEGAELRNARSPAVAHGWLTPAAKRGKGLIYVTSLAGSGSVGIYALSSDHRQVGQITEGIDAPYGLFVDLQRRLYVANANSGTITVYAPGSTTPERTLSGAGIPVRVAVAHDGTVYVASWHSLARYPRYGPGRVLEYARRATTPTKTLIAFHQAARYPVGLALDSAGDLFVAINKPCIGCRDHQGNNVGQVLELAAGSSSLRNLRIRVDRSLSLAIDPANNLLLLELQSFETSDWYVDVFPPGSNKRSNRLDLGFRTITDLALEKGGARLWVPWYGFSTSEVLGLTYPGGQIVDSFACGPGATAIALSPPE